MSDDVQFTGKFFDLGQTIEGWTEFCKSHNVPEAIVRLVGGLNNEANREILSQTIMSSTRLSVSTDDSDLCYRLDFDSLVRENLTPEFGAQNAKTFLTLLWTTTSKGGDLPCIHDQESIVEEFTNYLHSFPPIDSANMIALACSIFRDILADPNFRVFGLCLMRSWMGSFWISFF